MTPLKFFSNFLDIIQNYDKKCDYTTNLQCFPSLFRRLLLSMFSWNLLISTATTSSNIRGWCCRRRRRWKTIYLKKLYFLRLYTRLIYFVLFFNLPLYYHCRRRIMSLMVLLLMPPVIHLFDLLAERVLRRQLLLL